METVEELASRLSNQMRTLRAGKDIIDSYAASPLA